MPENNEFERGLEALAAIASHNNARIELLVPVARELAETRPGRRITVADLRAAAARRGYIPLQGEGRELSWLGAVFRRAGFKSTGEKVQHTTKGTHGKLVSVWYLPEAA